MSRSSDFANARAARWRELAPQLLRCVGGDAVSGPGNEENMRIALDFALGNFEEHTFGTFDPKRLRKNVLGLAEKFAVHSLDDVGRRLVHLHDHAVAASAAAEDSDNTFGSVDEDGAGCRTGTTTSAALSCVLALARAPMESIWERLKDSPDGTFGRGLGEVGTTSDEISVDKDAEIVAWNVAGLQEEDDDADEWSRIQAVGKFIRRLFFFR